MAEILEQEKLLQSALLKDHVGEMTPEERGAYEHHLCDLIGLNPLTRPFVYLPDRDKKLRPYLKKEAKEQIRKKHRISVVITNRELVDDIYIVSVRATVPDGRTEDSMGVVSLTKVKKEQKGTWKSGDPRWVDVLDEDGDKVLVPLKGEERANAMMRAATKATSRATLAISGAGFSEAQDIEDGDVEHLVSEPFAGTAQDAIGNIFGDDPPRGPEELRLTPEDPEPLPPEVQDSGREATTEEKSSIFIDDLEAAHAEAQTKYDFPYSLEGTKLYIEMIYNRPIDEMIPDAQSHILGWFSDKKSISWLSGELKKNQVAIKRKMPAHASANVRS